MNFKEENLFVPEKILAICLMKIISEQLKSLQ